MGIAVCYAELIGSRTATTASSKSGLAPVKTVTFVHRLRKLGIFAIDVLETITVVGAELAGTNDLGSFSNVGIDRICMRFLEALSLAKHIGSRFAAV